MKQLPAFALTCTLLLALGGCSSDAIPFSSGALAGQVVPNPVTWDAALAAEVVQLETNVDAPYSVNIWVIGKGDTVYVFAGDNRTNWVEHIEVNPDVRLQSGSNIYELTAERVNDAEEFERFASEWEAKYGRRPFNEDVSETYLLRLSPRA